MAPQKTNKTQIAAKVYEPNYIMKSGIKIWVEMFKELIEFRGLVWRLIIRDITAKYKQSIFGILWAFIAPLILMLIFVWIKGRNLLPIDETVIPYAAFVFIGQMVWLFFSQGVIASANSMVAAGAMLTKINFPREVLIFSAIGQTVFDFLIRIPLLIIIFIWVGFFPNIKILCAPLVLLPLLFLVVGLGFFLSLLNSMTRDIKNALGIIINLGMFLTPVIYPPPTSWPLSFLINTLNPVSSYITAFRDLTTLGYLSNPNNFILSVLFSFFLSFLGWRVFHLTEPLIAERV